jgi:hypothetical protein
MIETPSNLARGADPVKAAARERPILFSGPMVRAVCERRKTCTRRVMKPQPERRDSPPGSLRADGWSWRVGEPRPPRLESWPRHDGFAEALAKYCPYGVPGDRLWVRETWARVTDDTIQCRADDPKLIDGPWKPSIHMPRWASRLTLEVTEVRVQRVQEISEEDARAEGLRAVTKDGHTVKYGIPDRDGLPGTDDDGWPWNQWDVDPRVAFARAWDSINGKRSGCDWASNPWVWAIYFRPVAP